MIDLQRAALGRLYPLLRRVGQVTHVGIEVRHLLLFFPQVPLYLLLRLEDEGGSATDA